ncbi:MAG TPA: metallophosphoesterase [Myxococcales bacterium]|nr:metallophosphoesterase [Myxococcales bacterium]
MVLGRVWRTVRSLSERRHNLLAISDLHLGCDLRPGNKLDKPRPTDAPLAQFLSYHATHRDEGKPWRLILNGDIVDFVAITLVPTAPAPFEISAEERALGLAPTESKCVWKLRRTAERHPAVFDALARFVHRGNSVHIIRGNHDSEWRWPAVQQEFRRILAERSGAPRRKVDRLVEFHDWFYLEPGFFYAEHGHAHDHYSVQSDFFSAHTDDAEIQLPLSSKVLRYFVNRYTEQVEVADDVDTWGLRQYLDWVLKAGNPLRVAADYFVMVFRVIYPVVRQSLRISRAFARAADKALGSRVDRNAHARQLLNRFQGTEKQAHQLAEIASRPAEQSLFDSMQLFYLDRMLLAIASLAAAWTLSYAVHGFWAKGGALTCVGILFAALNALLGKRRRTDAHPMLQAAARRVAQIFDVKYIVMGHSHRAVEEVVGHGARYFNLGSWTPGRTTEGFPHLVVTGGSAELRRWRGPPLIEFPRPASVPAATASVPA